MTTRGNKDGNEPRSAPGPEGRREGGSDIGADVESWTTRAGAFLGKSEGRGTL